MDITSNKRFSCSHYHVAWVCAVADTEQLPARLMLDEQHRVPVYDANSDHNTYTCGSIYGHSVVIATCPPGRTGNVNAGRLVGHMLGTFPKIQMVLLVGIGGGIPSSVDSKEPLKNIHLGDVVVGWPTDGKPACVQHNRGKLQSDGQVDLVGTMRDPDWRFGSALGVLECDDKLHDTKFKDHQARLQHPLLKGKFAYPGQEKDMLFEAAYCHACDPRPQCTACDRSKLVERRQRAADDQERLVFHKGRIATGDVVIRNGVIRDEIGAQCAGALCVDMEAAGVNVNSCCLVIRGISDYADSHKNDVWRHYAAGNAAAFARELLRKIVTTAVRSYDDMSEGSPSWHVSHVDNAYSNKRLKLGERMISIIDSQDLYKSRWMASFSLSGYDERVQKLVNVRHPGTCSWIFSCEGVSSWHSTYWPYVLWISGGPGTGKSVALASLINDFPSYQPMHGEGNRSALVHAFCDERLNSTASSVLSVVIHQLLVQFPAVKDSVYNYDRDMYNSLTLSQHWTPKVGSTRPHIQLWNVILRIVKQARINTLYIVIDALDECDRGSPSTLFGLFQKSVVGELGIKFLFSGQVKPELDSQYSQRCMQKKEAWLHVEMEDFRKDIDEDIEIYARGELKRIAALKYRSEKEQNQICRRLLVDCSGMFLAAVFLLRELETRISWTSEQILDSIPPGLASLYGKLFEHLSHDTLPEQKQTLKYLAYHIGDMTPRDIAYACYTLENQQPTYISPVKHLHEQHVNETRRHLDCMKTMIRFRGENKPVSFIHKTAKEYLATLSGHRATSSILPKAYKAHAEIANTCLMLVCASVNPKSQLIFPDGFAEAKVDRERFTAIESRPFLEYALRNWYSHSKQAIDGTPEDVEIDAPLLEKIKRFVTLWNKNPSGLRHTLIRYSSINELARNGAEISILEVFSAFGLTRCLKLVLDEVQSRSLTTEARRAVLFAVRNGHEGAFDLLMSHFQIGSLDGPEYRQIISSSAWSGHFEVLEKILRLRNPTLEEFVAATQAAFSTSDYHILNRLIVGCSIFSGTDSNKRTALHLLFVGAMPNFAILDNNTDVSQGLIIAQIQFYVEHGVDINAQDRYGFTALHYACYAPQLCKRDLLLGLLLRGANPMLTTNGGLTVLHLAVRYARHPDAVQVLLDVTGNKLASMPSLGGNTPLHWAVQRQGIMYEQNNGIMAPFDDSDTFLEAPASHDTIDHRRRYPWETHSPSALILQLLIEAGANPHTRNKNGHSSFDRIRLEHVGSFLEWGHTHRDDLSNFVAAFRRLHPTPKEAIGFYDRSERGYIMETHLRLTDPEARQYPGASPSFSHTTGTFFTAFQTDGSDRSEKFQKKALWKSLTMKEANDKDGSEISHWSNPKYKDT